MPVCLHSADHSFWLLQAVLMRTSAVRLNVSRLKAGTCYYIIIAIWQSLNGHIKYLCQNNEKSAILVYQTNPL